MTDEAPPARRSKLAGFALLAAVVIGVLIVSVALRPDETEPTQSTSRPPREPEPMPVVFDDVQVDFADDRHGFALRSECVDDECERTLLVTDDGETWTSRSFDAELTPGARNGRVLAFGPCQVAVGGGHPQADRFRHYSDDCGHTWHQVDMRPEGTRSEIPPGATMEAACDLPYYEHNCEEFRLVVTLPDSGRRTWLETSPELERPRPESIPAPDGNWWVSGWDPATGELAVAVSRDDGRTWSVSPLGWSADGVDHTVVTATEHDAYVAAYGYPPDDAYGLLAIFHSGDGGTTWTHTWQPDPADPPWDGTPMARAEELLIIGWDQTRRSTDHGLTFDVTSSGIPVDWMTWTRGGFVGSSKRPWSLWPNWYRSPDGIKWERFTVPR